MADCVLKLSAGSILNMNTNLVTYWLNDKNNDLMIKTMIELGIYIADQLFTSAASVRQILDLPVTDNLQIIRTSRLQV